MVMHRDADPRKGFHIPRPKYEESKKALVGRAGLQALLHIFDSTDLGKDFAKCLPENGSNRSFGNYPDLWINQLELPVNCTSIGVY